MPPEATLDAMSTYLMTLVPQSKNDIDDILSMPCAVFLFFFFQMNY